MLAQFLTAVLFAHNVFFSDIVIQNIDVEIKYKRQINIMWPNPLNCCLTAQKFNLLPLYTNNIQNIFLTLLSTSYHILKINFHDTNIMFAVLQTLFNVFRAVQMEMYRP